MASTITPTGVAPATLHTSASLAASGTATDTLDMTNGFAAGGSWRAKFIGKMTFGTIAATCGIKYEFFACYNATGPVFSDTPDFTYTYTPASGSSTHYTLGIVLDPDQWQVKITNLDASNAVTCESKFSLISAVGVV